jgi:uncharacterized protein
MFLLRRLLLLIAVLAVSGARAEQVAGLYEADAPIDMSQPSSQNAAIVAAFKTVLVKVAGTRQVLDDPSVAQSIGRAKSYVIQFYFKDSTWPLREGETVAPKMLNVVFQPAAVQRILSGAGIPLLAPNRPVVLLWTLLEDEAGERIVNRSTDATAAVWLEMHAKRRGMTLRLPALDAADAVVNKSVVGALDTTVAAAASRRYAAAVVVLARMRRERDAWHGDWKLLMDEQTQEGASQAPTIDALDGQLIDFIAEAVTAKYAIAATAAEAQLVRIRIDGIREFGAYRRLEKALKGMGSVRNLQLVLIDGESLFFDLQTVTSLDSVMREITLIPQLQPAGETEGDLHYRWSGG